MKATVLFLKGGSVMRLRKMFREIFKYDTIFWKYTSGGLFVMLIFAFVGISLGMPTGFGVWFDIVSITWIGVIGIAMIACIPAGLLILVKVPIPRYLTGLLLTSFAVLSNSLNQFNLNFVGAAGITVIILGIGLLLGTSAAFIRLKQRSKLFIYAYASISIILLFYSFVWLMSPGKEIVQQTWDIEAIDSFDFSVKDPSFSGSYSYQTFTYGNGEDLHREEFAEGVAYVTPTVDASEFVEEWHDLRSLFWGFDESEIALNGRVWMPDGSGVHPLVLIVHGSHKMENFSDEGYEYLGELLASRGFVTISVDQNFINYSVWSEGIDWDMTTRAWVLLQHLNMLEEANRDTESPFYRRLDMDNVALVGHSRGGQAAALAHAFEDFYHKNNYPEISVEKNFQIQSIVAIAPIDRAIQERWVRLKNVNYLVLQGSQDSDVNTYYGDRQFRRISFHDDQYRFKAGLYIAGANHGQFNSEWGDADTSMPTALLLNKSEIMEMEEQQKIAKTYIASFLEATLNNRHEYLPLFIDYRNALEWLPDTLYISRFEDSQFIRISNYEHHDEFSTVVHDAKWRATELSVVKVQDVENRLGVTTFNKAVYIEWDGRARGHYTLELPERISTMHELNAKDSITFSLANAEVDELDDWQAKITVVVMTSDGEIVNYPLDLIPPVIHSHFTKHELFERVVRQGYLGESAEPIFQTYVIPFAEIIEKEHRFNPENLKFVQFVFEEGSEGKVFIDDVGFKKGFE